MKFKVQTISWPCCSLLFNPHRRMFIDFLKKFLFRERERNREGDKERERETSIDCLSYSPQLGTKPAPRYVPWLRIEPGPFSVQDGVPTNRATRCRAQLFL